MKVLVTGSNGFIGKNLLERLNHIEDVSVSTFSRKDTVEALDKKIQEADFIFHLAGINRPENPKEFYEGNRDLTQYIISVLEKCKKNTPIIITSSTQASRDNDYGKSKREAEELLVKYAENTNAVVYIYRLPNVFGKWSKPNYNTVIATWCYNVTRDITLQVNDESAMLTLVYIDDVVNQFAKHLDENRLSEIVMPEITPIYKKSLGEIRDLLLNFKESRSTLIVPKVGRGFERALYATYLSFLPTDKFSYELKGYKDERGAFYEFVKTLNSGQFSISTTEPGITRGNHYHNTKNEKFLVIKGKASIKHRQIHGDDIIEYVVSDKKMEVVEMIPGYTHNITNIGYDEMVLLLWANETFDRDNPDTYFLKV
jgi:UDP-2-acetamido-2,6-beta-L-arabino-hexul-4-ose reductase